MVRSDLILRSLNGTYASLADAAVGDISINVPVDVSSGFGIQIWGIVVQYTDGSWHVVDNKELIIMLSRSAKTAEAFCNDPDVIDLIKIHSELATNGSALQNMVIKQDYYPAKPYFGQAIHVSIKNSTGATQTIYVRILYSIVTYSREEVMGMMVNVGLSV